MKNKIIFWGLWLGAASCVPTPHPQAKSEYFAIAPLVAQMSQQLQQTKPQVKKTIVGANQQSITKTLYPDNWTRELQMFANTDISRPLYRGEYAVEQTANSLRYTAKDASLRTQSLLIRFVEGTEAKKIASIEMDYSDSNWLYTIQHKLRLILNPQSQELKQYSIIGKQSNLFGLMQEQYAIQGDIL